MYHLNDLVAREIQNENLRQARQARLVRQARQAAGIQPFQLIRRVLSRIERLFSKSERHPRPLTVQPLSSDRLHRI